MGNNDQAKAPVQKVQQPVAKLTKEQKLGQSIQGMKLHTQKTFKVKNHPDVKILRVPWGWLYNNSIYIPETPAPKITLQEIDPHGYRDKQAKWVMIAGAIVILACLATVITVLVIL